MYVCVYIYIYIYIYVYIYIIHVSGGTTCLTLLVQRTLSSNVAYHVASCGDPSHGETHKTHEAALDNSVAHVVPPKLRCTYHPPPRLRLFPYGNDRKDSVRFDSFWFRTFRTFIGSVRFDSYIYFTRFDAVRPAFFGRVVARSGSVRFVSASGSSRFQN